MFRFRSISASIFASSLSVTLLAGCPNAGTQPPTATPSTSPSAQPTTSAEPTTSPTSSATANPSMTPSTNPLEATTLRGKVFNESGATVSGAKVKVRSLSASNPFETTVDVTGGAYVANDVPAGVQVEVTAMKDNWTSRSRVEALLPLSSSQPNVVNFGGPLNDTEDPEGAAYFISNYPEVVSAVPKVEPAKFTYVIRFSEPLDATNQRRAENALSISSADPNGGFIVLKRGSTFNGDRVTSQITWDETGSVMTYTIDAPLFASSAGDKTYSLTFVRGESEEVVEDGEGNALGFMAPDPSSTYTEAFKLSALRLTAESTHQARWEATHTTNATFKVAKDETKPTLVSVAGTPVVVNGQTQYRFALTFSEPMRVFPEGTGFSPTVQTLSNYVFALSDEDLKGTDMEGTSGIVSTPTEAAAAVASEAPFRFAAGTVDFSTTDPKVVNVTVDRALVPTEATVFKVRVTDVADPAGNVINTGNKASADLTADNIKIGTI